MSDPFSPRSNLSNATEGDRSESKNSGRKPNQIICGVEISQYLNSDKNYKIFKIK